MKLLSLVLAAWPQLEYRLLYCDHLNVYFQVPAGYCTDNAQSPNVGPMPDCDISSYCKPPVQVNTPYRVSEFKVEL